jgi:hypothetical protein
MRAPIEVYFTNGQNTKVGQPLLLATGETQALVNVDLSRLGVVKVPPTFAALKIYDDHIDSLLTAPGVDQIWVQEGFSLSSYPDNVEILTGLSTSRLVGDDFDGWMYVVNGTSKERFRIADETESGDWGIDVPTTAPTVVSDDLVINGGFSSDTTDWTDENSAVLTSVSGGQSGNCLQITEGGASNPQCYQDITTVVGVVYEIRLYVKEGTATAWSAWKSDADGSDVVTLAADETATSAWVQHVVQFTATDTTSRIHLRHVATNGDGTTVLFDTVQLFIIHDADSGDYACYYSYVGKYGDDSEVESDISPAGYVSKVGSTIHWETLTASTDSQVTHKRLYRALLGVIYYVTEITNATTTYEDTTDDVTLSASTIFSNTGYYPAPDYAWNVIEHYRRMFVLVDGDYSHWLFWSEPQQPMVFVFDTDTGLYANGTDVFHKGNPCTGLAKWGGELFIASSTGFRRLVGSSPSYWALRDTLTAIGNIAKYAIITTRWGILHVWWDGVYLFNGYNSTKLTTKNEAFFKGINWDYVDTINASFDGVVYRLLVPYGTSTTPDRAFVMDFETYPRIRCYEENQADTNALYDVDQNVTWYARGDALGKRTGDENVAIDVYSKAFAVANLIQLDGAARLHYEIDTGGQDVLLTVYHDNMPHDTTITLNTESQTREMVSIPLKNARTIALRLSGAVNNEVTIYEPWIFSN